MIRKIILGLLGFVFSATCLGTHILAQSQSPVEGVIDKSSSFNFGDCAVSRMSIKYRVSTIVGEPAIYSNIKWKGLSENDNCLSGQKFLIFLKVGMGGYMYYLSAGGSYGMIVGRGDDKWGNNPLSGSPNWNKLFTKDITGNTSNLKYITDQEAKLVWKTGFRISGAVLVTSSGKIIDL